MGVLPFLDFQVIFVDLVLARGISFTWYLLQSMASRVNPRARSRGSIVASAHRDFVTALRAAKADAGAPSASSPRAAKSTSRSGSGGSSTPRRGASSTDNPSYLTLHARGNTGSKRAAMRARILQRRASRVHLPVVGPGAVPPSSMYRGGKPRSSLLTQGNLADASPAQPSPKKGGGRKPPPPLKRSSTESRLVQPPLAPVAEGGVDEEEGGGGRERSSTLPAAPPKRPPPPPSAAPVQPCQGGGGTEWPVFGTLQELLDAAVETAALGQDSLRCGAQLLGQSGRAGRWAEAEFRSWAQLATQATVARPEAGGGDAAAFPHFWLGTLIQAEGGGALGTVSTAELQSTACRCGLLQPITAAPSPTQGKSTPQLDVLDASTRNAAVGGNAAAQQQALAIVSSAALVRLLACGLPVWTEGGSAEAKQTSTLGGASSVGSSDDTSSDSDDASAGERPSGRRRPSMLGMQRNSIETLQEVASSTMAALTPRQGIALLHFARCHALSGLAESKAAIAGLLESACTDNSGAAMPEEHIDVVLQSALWWYEGAAEDEVESHAAGEVVSPSSCLAAGKLFLSGITPPLATTVYKNRKAMEAAASKNAEMRLRQAADICGLLPRHSAELGDEGSLPSAAPNSQDAADTAELLAGLLQRNALVDQFQAHDASAGEFLAPKLLPLPPSADAVLLPAELQALLADERRQLETPGAFLARASQAHKQCMEEVDTMLTAAVRLGSATAAFGLSIVYGEALSPQADALLAAEGGAAVGEKVKLYRRLAGAS